MYRYIRCILLFVAIIIFLFCSTPAPGFYNDDAIPDFMIKFAHGPGFPIYYYSEVTFNPTN